MTAVCMLYIQTVRSVLAADVVGNTSGLNSNDPTQYVIQMMSDAPDRSRLSFSCSLSFWPS